MIKYCLRILHFSFQELKSQFRIQTYLIFNLAFGIFGFLLLQIFQNSLLMQAQSKAQDLLAADFSISARRIFDPTEIQKMESQFDFVQKSEVKSFFAMAANDTKTRLVQVIAIDTMYPLYGSYKFKNDQGFSNGRKIWIDRDLILPLSLDDDSKIKLGQIKFDVADTVVTDPTRAFSPGGFAPLVYIPMSELSATELIQVGSTVNHRYLYKLKSQAQAEDIQKKLSVQIKDTTIKFETASENAKSGNQILKYFMDYLGLVSLVALGLSFLCGGYLLRWIFIEQKKNIAIYKTLGLQNSEIVQIQIVKNTLISVIAFVIAAAATASVLPVLQSTIAKYNLPVELIFGGYSFLLTLIISIFVPQMVLFPLLIEMVQLSARELFQAQINAVQKKNIYWIWLGVCLILFWILTIFQSQSIKTGTAFTVGLIALYLVFRMALFLMLKFLNSQLHKMNWFNRYALLGLIRRRQATDLVFVTMSLAILVLCLLPHIKSSIIEEIKPTSESQIPKLFLFDIQSEQQNSLQLLTEKKIGQRLDFTPLVRSRILKLNDENYERNQSEKSFTTREDEDDARFRNRGVNLTYKTKLQPSEKIVEGRWNENVFNPNSDQNKYPEISLEEKYADRIGAKLNDFMTFDVQGLEIKARVTSIRQVRWTSFQPNFFILFQTGVLEEAPQVFISSIANIDPSVVDAYQSAVVAAHPNVSIINVQQTVASIVVFIDQMSIALQAMAYLSMIVGLFVFVVLLNTQIRDRVVEMNLLQILGLSHRSIAQIVRRQFIFLLLLALVSGLLLSLISATLIVKFVFNIGVVFDWNSMWSVCVLLIPVSLMGIYWGMRPLAKLSPNELIRNQ
jgi:putative ABC transport system permease protein